MTWLDDLLTAALARRERLLARLAADGTDCWRWLHGATEGAPGVFVDRYGDLVLAQVSRAAGAADLAPELLATLQARHEVGDVAVIDRRRSAAGHAGDDGREFGCREAGMRFLVRAAPSGRDPWLFLDLRAGRRRIRKLAAGRTVLNLFAYTCTAGIAAALGGAADVWNVDFAASALGVGQRLARINGVDPGRIRFVQEDCLAVLRQLAGIPVQRRTSARRFARVERRRFGLVVLDPPRLASSAFGKVDVVRDYQSLFKPAWLATEDDGAVLATNHLASVPLQGWLTVLERCAAKAGRPIRSVEVVAPDEDFPSPDGNPPLKVAICHA